ncbi:replication-relaxation family protein [Streptomyces sp. RP5T]|uniref:replication-relaxation family protein n=1 Tax=Streptomyces sp. RP5T TaxID=2490848 RepID=UPI000F64ACC5|nr:replication-relaxation family protein [Streptomyces sp. RP5T]RRR86986.1 hypothetical protein EHS43_02465 [Streptomyces sp. RP5T]
MPAKTLRPSSEPAPSPSEPLRHQILAALAQHRIATTRQLLLLLRPEATRFALSSPMKTLREQNLIDYVVLPQSNRTRAWFLTPDGAHLTRDWPALRGRPPYPITSATAASLRTPHTLTVLRSHLAFAADARRRGDEHGPWDWTPEVSHNIGDGERVVADAVLHYTAIESTERRKLRAFIEVDRATMSSERLAVKLIDYARFWSYQPQPIGRQRSRARVPAPGPTWLRWYPVFPRILFVLTAASRQVLNGRSSDLKAMAAQHPLVAAMARQVPLGAAILEDLEAEGATGDVWMPLGGGEPRPWTAL